MLLTRRSPLVANVTGALALWLAWPLDAAALATAPAAVEASTQSPATPPADVTYIQMMTLHNRLTTELAQLAGRQGACAELRRLAEGLLADTEQDESELRAAGASITVSGRVPDPENLDDPVTAGLFDQVRALEGKAFDVFMTSTLLAQAETALHASTRLVLESDALEAYAQRASTRAARQIRDLRSLRRTLDGVRRDARKKTEE